ncbi:MAG: hypothetical protein HQK60_16210 [Deltaproteobacteria bacterium]|nr:hypothetical protein [Deltaproteobacteria bacterium]
MSTPVGQVPKVTTVLDKSDIHGTIMARLGGARDNYKISPGLYCVGDPDQDSPVLVTANYKLTFDSLRKELDGLNAWILVLDTRGINVWCAAGKKLFSTEEVITRVKMSGLHNIVKHKELILPQLAATGVSSHLVKKWCGFKVIWGPIRANDVKKFLSAGMQADQSMRQVTFTTAERLELIPVELYLLRKPALYALAAILLISGISPGFFSFSAAFSRGIMAASALLIGIVSGAVVVPILLPLLPGPAFYYKGALVGFFGGVLAAWMWWGQAGAMASLALLIFVTAISSFLAMNFTGSTPFTSPSGVEKEMREAIPRQMIALGVAVAIWMITGVFA